MKRSFVALMLLFGALVQFKCYAHSKDDHVKQMKEVFNGYDSDVENSNDGRRKYGNEAWEKYSFYRYYERFTFELDEYKRTNKGTLCDDMRKALKKSFGCDILHGGHRAYGHAWIMGASIRRNTVSDLEQKHEGAASVIEDVWNEFCKRHYRHARVLGFTRDKQAKAFSSIVHYVHLIGDREPENTRVEVVLPLEDLIKEISEQSGNLFGKDFGKRVKKELKAAYDSAPDDSKRKAQAVRKKLMELKFGTELHKKYGKEIKCHWEGDSQSDSLPHSH